MTASLPPVPLRFDASGGWCMGWYHAPAAAWHDLAIVLCPPMGYEAICSYPTYVQLARHLAEAGFPVLRFDYHGTADSSGDDQQPARLDAWRASVDAALSKAKTLSGARHLALFGLRLGATLAIEAAARAGGVDSLLLWAPCPTGKAYTRELRAVGTEVAGGSLLAMGHPWRSDTLADLLTLDATRPGRTPAARALVIGRDDLPAEGPVPKALSAAGVAVEVQSLPGYTAMVGEPRAGVLSPQTLAQITQWLLASPAASHRHEPAAPVPPDAAPRTTGHVRESVLAAGPDGALWGVLTEPSEGAAADRRGQTGVVLLNVGGNSRIGPHRIYVTAARHLAQAGYRVLRLDLAGIGDSPPVEGKPWANLYDKESAQDVQAAMEALAQRGCREFVLMGICSGSYVAFQTALVDPRVSGLVLMNSRLLEWTPGQPGDSWQNAMQQYVKSTAWYRRAAFRPEVWRRLLRGQVHVRPIAGRFFALALARLRRLLASGGEQHESLLGRMRGLCRRGTDVLMVVSDADDGRDYVEFHFGAEGRRMRAHPNYRMACVPDADHTFSRPGNQAWVLPLLLEFLDRRPAAPGARDATPAPASWPSAGARAPGSAPL